MAQRETAGATVDFGYETDFYTWTQTQAQLLRAGSEFDRDNVAEELEALGRSDRREVFNRLRLILLHLIKWECQPYDRSRSWSGTIRVQRLDLERVFKDSPSLRNYARSVVEEAFAEALDRATEEIGYLTPVKQSFKKTYTFEQAMDEKLEL